ncbi:uncharacterized protein LOC125777328 [Bactrocera dorsalis]|uniref:Uncharacterized protein LOC125777328 n=1 Tax=Bactrocera dorsalis TaxID=27457 RepID=A0ABM3JF25_BACDO|nr:uncharacterized protein LOC125777328 [Bactrocera dorsalis]
MELNRPNSFKNNIPDRKWLQGFLKRNPTVSQRVSQSLTVSRASVTESSIRSWFKRVYQYLENNNCLDVLEDSTRIFNCDESAFFLCPKGQAVLTKRGSKHVYFRSGNDDKECFTLCIGASASGKMMPTFALFPYKRLPTNILSKFPSDLAIGKSDSGWMTCETFYEYITNVFYPFILKENIQLPIVLFLDGHTSHLSLHLIEFCKKQGIILIALLPNSTHLLQSMDVAVFHSLKNDWRKQIQNWRMLNNGQRIKREDFGPIVQKYIQSTITSDILQNGFKACGIFPFNEDAVAYNKILKPDIRDTSNIIRVPNMNIAEISENYEATKTLETNSEEFLQSFEKRLPAEKLKLFIECSGTWKGDVKDENLFYFLRSVKNEQTSSCIASISNSDLNITSILANNDCLLDIENMSIDFIDFNEELVNKHNLSSSTSSCAVKSKQRKVVHILDSVPCPVAQAINFEDIPTTVNHPPRPQLPPREANGNVDVVNINSRTPPKSKVNAIEIK